MKTFSTIAVLSAALTLSACSGGLFDSNSRLGGTGANGVNGAGGSDISAGALAPNSVAYFDQTIGNTVLFAVDQSTLSPEARSVLTQQAAWLVANPSFTAVIEGHADEQGTRIYNLNLGSSRAAAVRDFLVSQGVSDARLQIVTYGKERPLALCSDEACYAKNRRSVTVIGAGAIS
ncbi:MAG: peptidoglycan-associated lipoprotein Pal [Litoreibacter sp.]|nr:peptidoglycan-associated lipoprotein Pal [Litoreibacter sp.]MCY4336519.1 peptidoglycan-associated lipoprotein Pal [Litoreibacter sp.]